MTYVIPFKISARSNPEINSIQTGENTLSSNSQLDVTITSVTITKAFLLFTYNSNNTGTGRNEQNQLQAMVLNSTTLRFKLDATTSASILIRWYVVEFTATSGAFVQHFNDQLAAGTTNNHTLSPTVTLANAFPLVSAQADGTNWDADSYPTAEITATNNVQLVFQSIGVSRYSVQVINNNRWSITLHTHSLLAGDSGNTDKTIASVPLADTIMVTSGRPGTSGNLAANAVFKAGLLNATTIRYWRKITGYAWTFKTYMIDGNGDFLARQIEDDAIADGNSTDTHTITAITNISNAAIANGYASNGTPAPETYRNDGDDRLVKLKLNNTTTLQADRINTLGAIRYACTIADFSPSL